MGKIEKGILGGFQGKIGTVVGGRWMGIDYMKSKNRKPTKPASDKQLVVRAKFLVVTRFISALGRLVTNSFKDPSLAMTGRNLAFHANYFGALTGSYPSFALDYTKTVVSKGELIPAQDPAVAASGNGVVKFTWTDNSGIGFSYPSDKSVLVVYCPEMNLAVFTTEGAVRSTGVDSINAGVFKNKTVETWISFVKADMLDYSTSIYTGQLVVS